MTVDYDVIVVGAGHAGTEASVMAARLGAKVLLLTSNLDTIGQMSCNPAIGGIAKGTVVREIDALGGIMGRATDRATIQFRMLNRSKGPAVWAPRAQCDRTLYRRAVRSLLEEFPDIELTQGMVTRLLTDGARVSGVVTADGRNLHARAVVLTAGTFLRGRIHLGTDTQIPAGRAGDQPAMDIAQHIDTLGLTVSRFKTGTPPRVDGRTVDWSRVERQDGDGTAYRFSFYDHAELPRQVPCWITWAGEEVKEIIRAHLGESALYGGAISGRGPRYCPSVEDKIVKFPDAKRHQVFLEPEGLDTHELYVNGLSTSLPVPVQLEFLRAVPGLERARMTRPGYAIEYDYYPPTQLTPWLETKAMEQLFFAGQINGTTGYEEAGGQGVVAGINAVRRLRGQEPGLLSAAELRTAERRRADEDGVLAAARATTIAPATAAPVLLPTGTTLTEPERVATVARRPGASLGALLAAAGVALPANVDAIASAEIELKYDGYLAREREAAARLAELAAFALPLELPYLELKSLATEARQKLDRIRPTSLAQAARIPGVSPSDLHNLVVETARWRRRVA